MFAFAAQESAAIKRQTVHKINEGLMQLVHTVIVSVHVIGVDVGNHRHDGRQIQKRRIRFIGFGNNIVTLTQLCIGTCRIQFTANDKRRIQTSSAQNRGSQTGGGGFAMRARNGNALAKAHQLCQHHRTWNHGNVFG